MRKKRIMIVGPTKSGKTTLANILNENIGEVNSSQEVVYGKYTIDIPSAYLENTWMYKHLIALSQDASHVLILVDSEKKHDIYPPGFAEAFNCPVIGIISKRDLVTEHKNIWEKTLKQMNIYKPYFEISATHNLNIDELKDYLKKSGYFTSSL